jgi:hypothetical protein
MIKKKQKDTGTKAKRFVRVIYRRKEGKKKEVEKQKKQQKKEKKFERKLCEKTYKQRNRETYRRRDRRSNAKEWALSGPQAPIQVRYKETKERREKGEGVSLYYI